MHYIIDVTMSSPTYVRINIWYNCRTYNCNIYSTLAFIRYVSWLSNEGNFLDVVFLPQKMCFFVFFWEGYLIFLLGISFEYILVDSTPKKIIKKPRLRWSWHGFWEPIHGMWSLDVMPALKVGWKNPLTAGDGEKTTEWPDPPGKRPALTARHF